jgi:hypothetical protein
MLYYADYQFNREVYLKNCINKAKPKLKCNGHCQLQKKLDQDSSTQDKQVPERKSGFTEEVISSKSFFATVCLPTPSQSTTFTHRNINTTIDVSLNLFHPPQAA